MTHTERNKRLDRAVTYFDDGSRTLYQGAEVVAEGATVDEAHRWFHGEERHEDPRNEAISEPLPPRSYIPTSTSPAGPQERREAPPCTSEATEDMCDHRFRTLPGEHCGHWFDLGRCCYCGAD